MKAYVFPGQGAQFPGMGKDLFEESALAREMFGQANEILGFDLTSVMFEGSEEALKQTNVTQPAIFLHSLIKAKMASENFRPDAAAGHSLGEFSALAACGALSFEDGLRLVHQRAAAMQKACEAVKSTMAAIVGVDDEIVEQTCAESSGVVVAANYNCPGQLVISGTVEAVEEAVEKLKEKGAKRAVLLQVGGAFHSPLMEPAKKELEIAIRNTSIHQPVCPIYQNIDAKPYTDPKIISDNLIAQLTGPVRWTQTMMNMIADGVSDWVEVGGNGKVLSGLIRRVDRKLPVTVL